MTIRASSSAEVHRRSCSRLAWCVALHLLGCGTDVGDDGPKDARVDADQDARIEADDAGRADAALDEDACVEHPESHVEIINACTDAESIDKVPLLPLLEADGTLPPLP